ncbi:hypothetical protein BDM02DRAFT_3127598 [Thelephora ganbajun]|uniref:Uncharacterized protein n=1 Tax=Thelephora ganbajun TaxID=370292 RepID=A0ACB6ZM17_THEGA|nr:hypothetical protein BDM02DRAFT_3127598 [Thelephora ganbajun]
MAIRAVGKDGKASEEDGSDWTCVKELSDFDDPTLGGVNVDPGVGEGIVEITKLVTVDGGLLTMFECDRIGKRELVSGGRGEEEELEGLEDEVLVGGKDEVLVGGKDEVVIGGKDELGVREDCNVEGGVGVEEGRDVKDVRYGVEMLVIVEVDGGIIVGRFTGDTGSLTERMINEGRGFEGYDKGRCKSAGIGAADDSRTEDVRIELESSIFIREMVEEFEMLGVTLGGKLVDGWLLDVRLIVLDVDGSS